ncbi:hypothetical protein HS088_TW03G00817 [Tripterygium wilfordii]|uniref:Uncharacterized protein n=1 Tax=Tripterygium wilfordii TaxID=458696 RepID=A0A7J7DVT2_TRIWF|nr:hypothetical protein HS088_TW03G00817 [Tripterygium wilfordii]
MTQFPQPTRPINSYCLETQNYISRPSILPLHTNAMVFEPSVPEESLSYQFSYECTTPTTTAATTEEKKEDNETFEEILRAISMLYEKLPASIRAKLKMEILNLPNKKRIRGSKFEQTSMRDLGGPLEELSIKLERFKVKTMEVGGVVKEEDKL